MKRIDLVNAAIRLCGEGFYHWFVGLAVRAWKHCKKKLNFWEIKRNCCPTWGFTIDLVVWLAEQEHLVCPYLTSDLVARLLPKSQTSVCNAILECRYRHKFFLKKLTMFYPFNNLFLIFTLWFYWVTYLLNFGQILIFSTLKVNRFFFKIEP